MALLLVQSVNHSIKKKPPGGPAVFSEFGSLSDTFRTLYRRGA
jgi:hypothetical protein